MTGRTFALSGACLAATTLVVLGYAAWLPDIEPLKRRNLMTTKYVSLYVERMRRGGVRANVRMRWVGLGRISPCLRRGVLRKEDDRFPRHRGVDWVELRKAVREYFRTGKKRGASTITQQVARNLFLSPSRRPQRKLKEILIARHLERSLDKSRILEIYLNTVEWGEGIFGAEAASDKYFHKHASELTNQEAAALVAALGSPYRWNPSEEPDERTRRVREKVEQWLSDEGYRCGGAQNVGPRPVLLR